MSIDRHLSLAVVAALCTILAVPGATAAPKLDELLTALDAGPNALDRLRGGEILSKELEASKDTELGVTLAMLVRQPPQAIAAFAMSPRFFEVDREVIASGAIDPAAPEAGLAGVRFEPSETKEIRMLLEAKPGKEMNLSDADLATIAEARTRLGGSRPWESRQAPAEASRAMREILARRLAAYQSKGLAGIEPYARGGSVSAPAEQLRAAQAASRALPRHAPALDAALRDFPGGRSASAKHFWRWVKIRAQDRAAFVLSHRMVVEDDGAVLSAERQFYVGHSFGAALVLAGLLEVDEGTVVLYASRLHTDEVAGGMGAMKRNIGRGMMMKSLRQLFEDERKAIEGK